MAYFSVSFLFLPLPLITIPTAPTNWYHTAIETMLMNDMNQLLTVSGYF